MKQKINGWTLLESEEDKTMLDHASRYELSPSYDEWHSKFIEEILKYYMPECSERRVVVDAGASYGWMSIPFSQVFNKVYAFEIVPEVADCLLENTKQLKNVEVFPVGLSSQKGTVKVRTFNSSGTSRVDVEGRELKVEALDNYNFSNVDLIKIDVEGHEFETLQGSIQTIKRCRPVIIVECNRTGRAIPDLIFRQKVFQLLTDLEYSFFDVRHQDFVFKPN